MASSSRRRESLGHKRITTIIAIAVVRERGARVSTGLPALRIPQPLPGRCPRSSSRAICLRCELALPNGVAALVNARCRSGPAPPGH